MNNGTQQVWDNWDKTTGTGETLTLNNTEEAPMSLVYKGNTQQSATPRPDYPQPIQVVSGDNSIVVCGKNLFNKDNANIYNGYFTVNSPTITSSSSHRTIYIPIEPNTTYTIQKSNAGGNDSRFAIGTTTTIPTTSVSVNQVQLDFTATHMTITTNAGSKYLVVWCYFTNNTAITFENVLSTIQVEKGSTTTTYEPYTGESYPINLGTTELCKIGTYQDKIDKSSGKNLLGINNVSSTTVSGITYSISNGVISLSGTANNTSGALTIDIPLLEILKPSLGTLTKSLNPSGTYTGVQTSLREQDANTSVGLWSNNASNNTGTISGDAYWFRIQINNGVSVNCTLTPQIELGTATSYEPYGTGWYVKKEIGKVVLDGTENWSSLEAGGAGYKRLWLTLNNAPTQTSPRTIILSDHFKFNNSYNTDFIGSGFISEAKLFLYPNQQDSTANFKTWLTSNNTTVYYPLATPTYTLIEDSTLIEELESMKKSYENQTNITQVNNDMPFILDITALSKE
jgi:hypothetical protein